MYGSISYRYIHYEATVSYSVLIYIYMYVCIYFLATFDILYQRQLYFMLSILVKSPIPTANIQRLIGLSKMWNRKYQWCVSLTGLIWLEHPFIWLHNQYGSIIHQLGFRENWMKEKHGVLPCLNGCFQLGKLTNYCWEMFKQATCDCWRVIGIVYRIMSIDIWLMIPYHIYKHIYICMYMYICV